MKAESLPQYCDRSDSIERKPVQRRSSNETATTGICYATFSKGMYKSQHIYENDCIIQRPSIASRGACEIAADTDDDTTATSTAAPNHPLYAVVNKNNKSKNKQSNELAAGIAVQQQQHTLAELQAKAVATATTAITTHLLNNNNHNFNSAHNGSGNVKLRVSTSHTSSSSNSSSCSASDIMGNMLQADATILDASGSSGAIGGGALRLDHHTHHNQGQAVNKAGPHPHAANKFDPILTTTTITADALKGDSNAEHSIYAKVWKGPRKTSESKMYAIMCDYIGITY